MLNLRKMSIREIPEARLETPGPTLLQTMIAK